MPRKYQEGYVLKLKIFYAEIRNDEFSMQKPTIEDIKLLLQKMLQRHDAEHKHVLTLKTVFSRDEVV